MRGTALVLVGLLAVAALPVAAQPLEAGSACGGNAYSSAEVTEGRGRRRGPLTAMPDTLCADIETGEPPVRIDLYGIPGRDGSGIPGRDGSGILSRDGSGILSRDGSASGLGGRAGSAPYDRAYRRRVGPSDE